MSMLNWNELSTLVVSTLLLCFFFSSNCSSNRVSLGELRLHPKLGQIAPCVGIKPTCELRCQEFLTLIQSFFYQLSMKFFLWENRTNVGNYFF